MWYFSIKDGTCIAHNDPLRMCQGLFSHDCREEKLVPRQWHNLRVYHDGQLQSHMQSMRCKGQLGESRGIGFEYRPDINVLNKYKKREISGSNHVEINYRRLLCKLPRNRKLEKTKISSTETSSKFY